MKYKTYKESYKHKAAKKVLSKWLEQNYTVKMEQFFGDTTFIFSPDVVTFTDGQIDAFWEVEHKNGLSDKKLGKMQYYCYLNGLENMYCYEVSADWILEQCEPPDMIVKITYKLS